MSLVRFSIRRPVTISMVMIAIAVFGVISLKRLPMSLLPDISYPTLTVRTKYPGAAPNEVESLISKPIESAVGVVQNVVRVSSISRPGVSDVIIEFNWKTNMDFAALDVREKLDLLNLPKDAEKPILLRYDPSLDPIVRLGLSGDEDLMSLRVMAEDDIKPKLEGLDGVAAVKVSGGLEEEIQVEVDEKRLAELKIPISLVAQRLKEENVNLTGGTLRDGETEYLVRTINEFHDVDDIGKIIILSKGDATVELRDVAKIRKSYKDRTIITRIDGKESVEISLFKEANANTVTVAREIKKRVAEIQNELERTASSIRLQVISDQSVFIEQSVREVLNNAILGGLLAILVLYLFLHRLSSTAIIGLAIPMSIVATFFLMYISGISLNIMSLGGLALGVGMLVDNAIVVLESIDRHRDVENENIRLAAERGTTEVSAAVTASTLTSICVFVPIVFVKGIAGQLFTDQSLTVTYSLLMSLIVALTLIPMLSAIDVGALGESKVSVTGFRKVAATILFLLALVFAGAVTVAPLPLPIPAVIKAYGWKAAVAAIVAALLLGAALAGLLKDLIAQLGGAVRRFVSNPKLWLSAIALAILTITAYWFVPESLLKWAGASPAAPGAPPPPVSPSGQTSLWSDVFRAIVSFFVKNRIVLVYCGWGLLACATGLAGVFARAIFQVSCVLFQILDGLIWPAHFVFNAIFGAISAAYPAVLRTVLRFRVIAIVVAVALGFLSHRLFQRIGMELIPEMSQGEILADLRMPVGAKLAATSDALAWAERNMRKDPVVGPKLKRIYTIVGARSQAGGSASEERENIGQLVIQLKPGVTHAEESRIIDRCRQCVAEIPSAEFKFSRPTYFSLKRPIEVEIMGYNLVRLRRYAAQIVEKLKEIPQLSDVRSSMEGGNPEIQILFNRRRLAMIGMDIATVANIIRDNVEGEVSTELTRKDRKIDIRVRALPRYRSSAEALKRLIVNPSGAVPVPLSAVATVCVKQGPSEIRRVDQERVAIVSANIKGYDLAGAVRKMEPVLKSIPRPVGLYWRMGGQRQEMAESFNSMKFAIALAIFLVYLVMASQFESLIHPFVILFTIPFALVGVVLALALTGSQISVVVLIGVVMLAGIVVNNAIVLVDCINRNRRAGMELREAIVEAGQIRLRPIVMTTLTTVLGLLPMALGLGEGAEVRAPMAITVIGGLSVSTLLTLLFVPTVYLVAEQARGLVARAFARRSERPISESADL